MYVDPVRLSVTGALYDAYIGLVVSGLVTNHKSGELESYFNCQYFINFTILEIKIVNKCNIDVRN